MNNTNTTSAPAPTEKLTMGISHVGLAVSKLEATLDFFQALGFKKIGGVESYPSIFLTDGTIMITLWQTDNDATPFDRRKNVGLHHLAIRVPSLEALQAAFDVVTKKVRGVEIDFEPTELKGTPLHHAMVFEPSGNRIEFTYHANQN